MSSLNGHRPPSDTNADVTKALATGCAVVIASIGIGLVVVAVAAVLRWLP